MNKDSKGKYIGITGTILVHAILLLLFLFLKITSQMPEEERTGLMVMIGNHEIGSQIDHSKEIIESEQKTEVKEEKTESPKSESKEEPLITQDEPSLNLKNSKIKPKQDKPKEQPKNQTTKEKPKDVKQEKKVEQKDSQEDINKKIQQEAINKVSNAFGKSNSLNQGEGQGGEEKGSKGKVDGNSDIGNGNNGGYGNYDLGGRKIGKGGLPKPSYNTKEEGKVVVNIIVNNKGQVISATINPKTNTVSNELRKAAIDAARKAIFESIEEDKNQTGTITYFFELK